MKCDVRISKICCLQKQVIKGHQMDMLFVAALSRLSFGESAFPPASKKGLMTTAASSTGLRLPLSAIVSTVGSSEPNPEMKKIYPKGSVHSVVPYLVDPAASRREWSTDY